MKKIVWTFGLIAGAIVSLLLASMMFNQNMNMDYGEILGYTTMIIAFSTIFIGIKNFRDKHQDGKIKFGTAFKIGLYISLIASTMYVASWVLINNNSDIDFTAQYSQHMIKKMEAENSSQEEIEAMKKEMEEWVKIYENPFVMIAITYTEILPVGLLVSLISAGILKNDKQ